MKTHPLLLGHRGARGANLIPENTPAAFELALASGCDGFEFDVRLSSDGQAVVCHDADTRGYQIARCPAEHLELPLLREVLTRYRRRAFLDIELKTAGVETIAAKLLRELRPAKGFMVSSFLPEVIEILHRLDKTIPLGMICETQTELRRWRQLPMDCVIAHHKLLRRDLVHGLKAAGKKIFVWTVNSRSDMKRFAGWQVDGIISDYPERLALTLGRRIRSEDK